MALISLQEAAGRIGIPPATIEEWGQRGLVVIQLEKKIVDEDQLMEVAESLGWLRLSADHWENAEEE